MGRYDYLQTVAVDKLILSNCSSASSNALMQERSYRTAVERQVTVLFEWVRSHPAFHTYCLDDRVLLLGSAWNEIVILELAHRSINVEEAMVFENGLEVRKNNASHVGLHKIFDRVLKQLVVKFKDMKIDKSELGLMKAILLYNPHVQGLSSRVAYRAVSIYRDQLYNQLDTYCAAQYPNEPTRFGKILLKLPDLRAISVTCVDHLFRQRIIAATPIQTFLKQKLDFANNFGGWPL